MAQTWPQSRARRFILGVVDSLGRAAARVFRRRLPPPGRPSRILVIEPWHIGDVVLVTPLLQQLREVFPDAHIAMLAKAHAREILGESELVDDFIDADLSWTRTTNKYPLSLAAARELRSLVVQLRNRKFDVTIDARMDIRSNLLAWSTGAPVRIGYDIGGGGWLLTQSLPAQRDKFHKTEDWLALAQLLPGAKSLQLKERRTTLTVRRDEMDAARQRLLALTNLSRPIIGYHSGGSHPGKRWPLSHFQQLAHELAASIGGTHVWFTGPDDEKPSHLPSGLVVRSAPLREFMAEVSLCDVLICNDSGPMHIADALGVPVAAIFEVGNPQWYGPSGPRAVVISGELAGRGMSAAPLDAPPANPVAVQRVKQAVENLLARVSPREERVTAGVR